MYPTNYSTLLFGCFMLVLVEVFAKSASSNSSTFSSLSSYFSLPNKSLLPQLNSLFSNLNKNEEIPMALVPKVGNEIAMTISDSGSQSSSPQNSFLSFLNSDLSKKLFVFNDPMEDINAISKENTKINNDESMLSRLRKLSISDWFGVKAFENEVANVERRSSYILNIVEMILEKMFTSPIPVKFNLNITDIKLT